MSPESPIILYDGVCGLCNRMVQFVLKRDRRKVFRFASLQSGFAAEVLRRHGESPTELSTMYVVLDYGQPGERLLERSDAAAFVLNELEGIWKIVAAIRYLPRFVRDWGYRVVARNRYKWFGKHDTCPVPRAEERERFVG